MTDWTPQERSGEKSEDQYLLVESTYMLSIGDGFSLLIQESGPGTEWTAVTKS